MAERSAAGASVIPGRWIQFARIESALLAAAANTVKLEMASRQQEFRFLCPDRMEAGAQVIKSPCLGRSSLKSGAADFPQEMCRSEIRGTPGETCEEKQNGRREEKAPRCGTPEQEEL